MKLEGKRNNPFNLFICALLWSLVSSYYVLWPVKLWMLDNVRNLFVFSHSLLFSSPSELFSLKISFPSFRFTLCIRNCLKCISHSVVSSHTCLIATVRLIWYYPDTSPDFFENFRFSKKFVPGSFWGR